MFQAPQAKKTSKAIALAVVMAAITREAVSKQAALTASFFLVTTSRGNYYRPNFVSDKHTKKKTPAYKFTAQNCLPQSPGTN